MMEGFDWRGQQDFSAGAFPLQERVPRNAVEDCVNGLYEDDGSIFKRGGGAYKSASAWGTSPLSIFDRVLGGGQRTVFVGANRLGQLAADDQTPEDLVAAGLGFTFKRTRAASLAGMLIVPALSTSNRLVAVGGSRTPTASYNTGTVDLVKGSRTVTGAGTTWLANVDPGMILNDNAATYATVAKVVSDTELLLATPWPLEDTTGVAYTLLGRVISSGLDPAALHGAALADQFIGTAGNRLIAGAGSVVAFSPPLDPFNWNINGDYHVLPDGAALSGIQGFRDSALLLTTDGIYLVGNVSYDLTDALGNVQQTLSNEGHDVILWDNNGVAGVDGGVLIPALDDLYLFSGKGLSRFEAPGMRRQWRTYVKAGHVLGNAAVHRGHYFLPILDSAGTTLQDVLCLKLSTGAWSRWSGHSAGVSFAQRRAGSSSPPKLLAAKSTRILDLTGTFEPAAGNKNEADGSTHTFTLTCRTERRRDGVAEVLRKVRVRYELDDAAADNPTVTAAVAVGRPGSAFTALTGAGAENAGQTPKTWRVGLRGTEARVKLTSVGPSAALVIRSVEQAWFLSGRQ